MLIPVWWIAAALVVGFVLGLIARGSRDAETILPPQSPVELEARIRGLLAQGKKIQAIKLYRQFHHADLKGAKNAVEDMDRRLSLPPGTSH